MSAQQQNRFEIGQRVQVIAIQSERRGERGTVIGKSATRNIYDVRMDTGLTESRWPGNEIKAV